MTLFGCLTGKFTKTRKTCKLITLICAKIIRELKVERGRERSQQKALMEHEFSCYNKLLKLKQRLVDAVTSC